MSTGDGICSICGLPLGPSSNPRVATCQGHRSTLAITLEPLTPTPDAGDVANLAERIVDALEDAIQDDAEGVIEAREQALPLAREIIAEAAAREAQLCVAIGRAFDALQEVGYPDDVSDIVDDMKIVAHDQRSDAARKIEDLLYAATAVCAVADEGTRLDLAIEALGEAVEDFMGKDSARIAKAAREAQLRGALERILTIWTERDDTFDDLVASTKYLAETALAAPASPAAERVLAVTAAACELTDGIRNKSVGFTITADRLMEKVDALRALDGGVSE